MHSLPATRRGEDSRDPTPDDGGDSNSTTSEGIPSTPPQTREMPAHPFHTILYLMFTNPSLFGLSAEGVCLKGQKE